MIEKKEDESLKLFIMLVKNPRFFTIIGESNLAWEKYRSRENERLFNISENDRIISTELTYRKYQDKWRTQLAEEMMNFTVNDSEVFCPFTLISADFEDVGTMFRASHIKRYSESNEYEKYDVNNGLLLIANADALFDKHYITVDENKNLIFSFLIDQDYKLKSQLMLNQPIFKEILNEDRMEYIKIHREIFLQKEAERRTT